MPDQKRNIYSVRILICVSVFLLVAVGAALKIERAHRLAEFKKGIARFEEEKEKDSRFTNAYVSYWPNPPSVIILAYGLPPVASNDLKGLVEANFSPLQVQIYYKNETDSTNR